MIHFSPTEYRCMIAGIACFAAFIWALKALNRQSKQLDAEIEDTISGPWNDETIN